MKDIVLISMPWAPPHEPSLGLAILKAGLKKNGYNVKVLHTAPKLLKWITMETYGFLAGCWGIDEFLFTSTLDPICDEKQLNRLVDRSQYYLEANALSKCQSVEDYCNLFFDVRHRIIPEFLNECLNEIIQLNPSLVGFTCMFDQTISSVALSKLLKDRIENLTVVFGGYALEGSASTTVSNSFPWIDCIVQGDGEKLINDIADNIINKRGYKLEKIIKAEKISLNDSPNPDYDDWFDDLSTLELHDKLEIKTNSLPVESSRGCWWGQHMHCIFCGIDDETMKYRYKAPEKTLEMLRELRGKYGSVTFRFSDYIMPKAYYTTLMEELAEEKPKFRLQAEIKANHTKERIKSFANAGFFELQPGIESFSTSVLKSMDKGVRAIDNVKLLKYGYIYGIIFDYNFLYGLPDDKYEDYEKMTRLIPRIYHLTPPISRNETVVTKFAPLHMNPSRFNIKTKAQFHRSYETLFSDEFIERTKFNINDFAYYFDRNFEYDESLEVLYSQIVIQIGHWKEIHKENFIELSFTEKDGCFHFMDSRFSPYSEYFLSGIDAYVYKVCDEAPIKVKNIPELLLKEFNFFATIEEVESSVSKLSEDRLIWEDLDLIFGLGIPKEIVDIRRENEWTKSWMSIYI